MLKPDGIYPPYPAHVDVRDVAKACVRGLELWKPAPAGERNRAGFLSPQYFDYSRAKAVILERYPNLKSRVIAADPPPFYGPSALEYEWGGPPFWNEKGRLPYVRRGSCLSPSQMFGR